MKTIYIYITILLIFISCKKNIRENIVPDELDIKWYSISYDNKFFYKKNRAIGNNPFNNDIMLFSLPSGDEYAKIKKVIKTKYGYRIVFKEFRFNAEFRFYWINKKQGIAKWEFYNNDKKPLVANYCYYTINNIDEYNKLFDRIEYNNIKKKADIKTEISNQSILNTSIEESWKTNCDKYMYLHIDNDSLFTFPVNSNTMYINVLVKKVDNNQYNLFYDNIEDLGRGVKDALDWNNFSKDSILATLEVKDKYLFLNWYGFYNKKNKNRDWTDQIDFQEDAGKLKNIQMLRCNLNESY